MPQFDMKRTKIGMFFAFNSSSFTSSSSLSICLQINCIYLQHVPRIYSMVYCIQCFYPQYGISKFFSLLIYQQFSSIFCVYLSTDRSHCTVYPCKVSIFLQCLSMESTDPIYLQCIAVCSPCVSTVSIFFTVPNYCVWLYTMNMYMQCLSIYSTVHCLFT